MKKIYCILISICCVVLMVSCGSKNTNEVFYSEKDIYINCIKCDYISGFPKELLMIDSEQQMNDLLDTYEGFSKLPVTMEVMEDYPVGEYIYIIQYMEVGYGAEVTCEGLLVDKDENRIHLECQVDSRGKEGPAAIDAYIAIAILAEECLEGLDF